MPSALIELSTKKGINYIAHIEDCSGRPQYEIGALNSGAYLCSFSLHNPSAWHMYLLSRYKKQNGTLRCVSKTRKWLLVLRPIPWINNFISHRSNTEVYTNCSSRLIIVWFKSERMIPGQNFTQYTPLQAFFFRTMRRGSQPKSSRNRAKAWAPYYSLCNMD